MLQIKPPILELGPNSNLNLRSNLYLAMNEASSTISTNLTHKIFALCHVDKLACVVRALSSRVK